MLVQCTGCGTSYKIADEKVPETGVKVKCPKCRVVFLVRREADSEPETLGEKLFGKDVVRRPLFGEGFGEETAEIRPGGPGAEQAEVPGPTGVPIDRETEEQPIGTESRGSEPQPEVEEKSPAPPEDTEEETRTPVEETVCESSREATVRAEDPRNLARALISDVLFYNREKRDKGLAEGKVLAYLGKEIARSWELYKDRLGIENAVGTDDFREAVNDILGENKEIL
ncbi:MAG: zinc-ribbon domain-containing protein [Candidatus Eisenbacteria bacterium]|nr:zinc-ribbon domain-containing protein [Candidatus Eisenbacteria bacterium]